MLPHHVPTWSVACPVYDLCWLSHNYELACIHISVENGIMHATPPAEKCMATYKDLKAQAEALAEKAEAARLAEFQAVLDEVRAKVVEYGITEKDIFGRRRGQSARSTAEAKYLDPKTGATWSGRGRAPAWIKDAKNRDRFLIKE